MADSALPEGPVRPARSPSRGLLRAAAGLALAAVAGCSSMNSMLGGNSERDALGDLKWSFAADGIQLEVTADPLLNRAEGQAHTLLLVVVQMEDPNAFTGATGAPDKLTALLMAQSAPAGMLGLNRVYVAPGSTHKLSLPRIEKAQYIGVAAGYFHLDPSRSTRLYRIGVDVATKGIIIKNRTAAPEPLLITLQLGPDGIIDSPSERAIPPEPQRPQGGLVQPAAGGAPK